MTDRAKGLTVALDRDIRVDDVEVIIQAIKMIKGVADVRIEVREADDWLATHQARTEIREKLYELIKEI